MDGDETTTVYVGKHDGVLFPTIVRIVHGCDGVTVKIRSSESSRGYGCLDVHRWMAKCVSLTSASSC